MKGYVVYWREQRNADGLRTRVEVSFDSRPNRAGSYASQHDAEMDCSVLNSCHIAIESAEGGTHICSCFQAEQTKGGRFVIYCEAPFVSAQPTGQSADDEITSR
jgi:hypothetical protein